MQDIAKDILIQASEGDMGAFEQIYRATSGFVYTLAFRITNNAADAQEVTQDVFLKIYKNLKKFQFRSSFKTWVYRIAVNTAINSYRRTVKELKRKVEYDEAVHVVPAPDRTDASIDAQDNRESVQHLLRLLNPDQRACLLLREIERLSYREIAGALKINLNTVRTRLKRAREALMAYNKKRGDGEWIAKELETCS